MRGLLHQRRSGLDIVEPHVLAAGDVDEHAVGAVDTGLQQRALDGGFGGVSGLTLTDGGAHAHVGVARVLHDGGHVGKVQVDEAGVFDEVGDADHRLTQHVVRDLKGVGQCDLLVGSVFQAVVGDDDQAVHVGQKILDALLGLEHSALALPGEGLGDHADGEDSGLLGGLRHGGGRAGARAAAHAGGDEDHVAVLDALGDVVAALLRAALAHLRIAARALAVSQLLADLHGHVRVGDGQRLLVGIDVPEATIRFTTLFPAPPTPTTLMVTTFSGPVSGTNAAISVSSKSFYQQFRKGCFM